MSVARSLCALALLCRTAAVLAADAAPPVAPDPAVLDWYPRALLAPELAAQVPGYCEGTYVEPAFALPRSADSAGEPLEAQAGHVEYWIDDRAVLDGDVRIVQGNRSLTAARAVLEASGRNAALEGPVMLREPGLLLRGADAEMNTDTGAAVVRNVEFVLHGNHMRGSALRITRDEAGDLEITRAAVTRCEPGDDSWTLASREIHVGAGATHGSARDAVLRVKRVPVLYTPYIQFPLTDARTSGFLLPNLDYSDDDGFDIGVPYYFNLAPNYDATVSPRYITRRGAGAELEFRHLSRRSRSVLGGAYLHRDDQFNGAVSRENFDRADSPGQFEPADRWLTSLDHRAQFADFGTHLDYAAVSDGQYFRDLGTDLSVQSQIHLERRGELNYARGGLQGRLWAQNFQVLDDTIADPYQRLPELELAYQRPVLGSLRARLSASWSRFDRDNDDLSGRGAIVGDRLHIEPRLRLPLEYVPGFLRFETGFRHTAYRLDDVPDGFATDPERGIGFGSVDGGLFFERQLTAFGGDWIQTLEPRLFYLYQAFEDQSELPRFEASALDFSFQQLFRDNRFAGLDRIGDANRLSIAVTSRVLEAGTGREWLRGSLGQIVHFDEREVTLGGGAPALDDRRKSSDWAGELTASLGEHWQARTVAIWDPYDSELNEMGFTLDYRREGVGGDDRVFRLAYRGRRDPSFTQKQGDFAVYWPVARRWRFLGGWNYDFEEHRTIEAFGGLEYNDCCWQIRLVGHRVLDIPDFGAPGRDGRESVDRSVLFQVAFKGLAGFGGKVDSLLQSAIPGYRPER